jgi:hypothetical protein
MQITFALAALATVAYTIAQDSVSQPTGMAIAAVTEISDGQPRAPTAPTGPVVTEISDGQPPAPTASDGSIISEISNGQLPDPTGTLAVAPAPTTNGSGAAPTLRAPSVTVPIGTAPTLPGGVAPSTASILTTSATGLASPSPVIGNGNAVKGSMGLGAVAMIVAALL